MGAEKPEIKQNMRSAKTRHPLLLLGLGLLLAIGLFQNANLILEPQLNPKEAAKLQKRLTEIDEAEQYALIANEDGWYPCNHPGRATFHLLPGEVWKYGTTTKGQFGRYNIRYLEEKNVSYIIQFKGTIGECLKEEQRKLFSYPYLPENLVRPEQNRLPRPPYNSKMQ
ncbi:MAG: hypothetical protein WCR52_13775 [Bacteroidota bacterium]